MRILLSIFTLFVFTVALPSAHAESSVQIGDTIPAISQSDQNGNAQSYNNLSGEKGAVLVFVRSADWCPYCQKQLIDLNDRASDITDKGYSLITLSYDDVAVLKAFSDKYEITYPMLSDSGSETIKDFGILNTDIPEGSSYYGIPYPKVYVLDNVGKIVNILAKEGYKERPSIDEILAVLH